jgi:putative hydrolase of the HAD superfamily
MASQTTQKFSSVLFDLGGVIFDSPLQLIAQHSSQVANGNRRALPEIFLSTDAFPRLESGHADLSSFIKEFTVECQKRGISEPKISELFESIAQVRPRPVMLGAVVALRRHGFSVGAVTNNWSAGTREEDEKKTKFLNRFFDVVVESFVEKVRKPDPKIFRVAMERLGIRGAHFFLFFRYFYCIFLSFGFFFVLFVAFFFQIDATKIVFLDDLGVNLKAARRLGFETVLVRDPREAITELGKKVGVETLLEEADEFVRKRHEEKSKL